MRIKKGEIYPDCPTTVRTVEIGSLTKSQLFQKLKQHSILLNKFAEQLFTNDKFIVSDKIYNVKTVELEMRNLGFP